jgi:TonB-linked SusC/RagA family outer membrane protein
LLKRRFIKMSTRIKIVNKEKPAIVTVLLLFALLNMYGQDSLVIRGTIVDGANQPVENVSVVVEGSGDLPVFTNELGDFRLMSNSGDVWLNIAPSSGFKTKRIYLDGQKELKIYLTPLELESGEDRISILNIPTLRKDMPFAFDAVSLKDIVETPLLTVDQYLQGRTSGLLVQNRSGDLSGGATTFLRGVNSLNTTNAPLYVVDGIPLIRSGVFNSIIDGFEYNQLLVVNPMDISRATVVKDPALTAVYGSKASNGLILIETLDPSATQTSIELDLRRGYSMAPSNLIPQLNANQHKTLISEVLFSSGEEEELIRYGYPQLFLQPDDEAYPLYQHNTNWQQLVFQDAAFTNLSVKVKGGDEIAKYGLSFGFVDGEGIIKTNSFSGYNLRFRGLLNIFTWLKMNSGVSLSYNNASLVESARVGETSPIMTSLAKSPMHNPYQYIYDVDGKLKETELLADVDQLGVSNPLAAVENGEATNDNFNSTVALGFIAELSENMQLMSNFGINYAIMQEQVFMPNIGMERYYNDEAHNVAKASNNSLNSLYNNTGLNFVKDFGKHKITSATGVNIQRNQYQYDWALTKNASQNDEFRRLQDGTDILRELGGSNRYWNWMSFYESVNYNFKDKYLAVASLSLDASTRIGKNALNTIKFGDVPFGLFYSAGIAWRISNEPFLRDIAALEELKLRVSYGVSGNDDVGESTATNYYQAIKYRETVGLIPAVSLNEELTYETVAQLNVGLDLALLGDRFRTSIDAYRSNTDNMLVYKPLPPLYGFPYRAENGGEMRNMGIDVNLFYRVIDMTHFSWDLHASFSTVKNEVTRIEGDKLITLVEGAEIVNMPGEQANSYYGYVFEGVYSTSQEAETASLKNNKLVPYQAGDAIFKDLNGDSIINDLDKDVIGSSMPEYWGGIGTSLKYKRWELDVFVQFVGGNEIYNYVRYKNERMSGIENQSTRTLNRWQFDGQQTEVPRAIYDDKQGNSAFSTRWIEDGSYLRLKNISFSYNIPDEFLAFKSAKIYISASNLFTSTSYLGYDPDFSYSNAHYTQGIDYGLTPQPRTFLAGIKLGF